MKKIVLLSFLPFLILNSCSRRLVDFTIISTKNVDLTRGASFERGKSRIDGEDKIHIILFIPTGTPSIKEAIDNAIESIPGCVALLDGVVYAKSWWIPYIYGQSKYLVEGTPLIDPKLVYENYKFHNYEILEFGKKSDVIKSKIINKNDYLAYKNNFFNDSKALKFKNSNELNY